jgi:hypothetical protein
MRAWILAAVVAGTLMLSACGGQPRYSDDAGAARIQALTDFCSAYGVMLDLVTPFVVIDVERTTPKLSQSMVEGYHTAINVISPFCSPTFDPTMTPFDLSDLSKQLKGLRLVLLKMEEGG